MHSYMTDAEGRKTDCRPGHSRKRDKECRDGAKAPSLLGVLRPEHSGERVDSQPCSPWSELPARASANSRQQSMESLFLWRLCPERTSTARCLSVHPLSSYSQEAKGRQYQPSTKKRATFLGLYQRAAPALLHGQGDKGTSTWSSLSPSRTHSRSPELLNSLYKNESGTCTRPFPGFALPKWAKLPVCTPLGLRVAKGQLWASARRSDMKPGCPHM